MKQDQSQVDSSVIELLFERAKECDEFENYAHPHAARVAAIADELAKRFNLGIEDRVSLKQASLAHDLGELAMGREYVLDRGPLTSEQRIDMKRHTLIGEQEAARAGADRAAQLLVRWCHEWWNGAGYPDALRQEQIPLTARILRVADAFVSYTDNRPYRKAFTLREAKERLRTGAGLEFDPHVIQSFLSIEAHPAMISYAPPDESKFSPAASGQSESEVQIDAAG